MKFGLMYYRETDNIGDDIQTYAAMRFLPNIDYYIDRENLSCFIPEKKEYVSMIMNGWFLHNKMAWPPSPYINPLLVSMHFTELNEIDVGINYLNSFGGQYLKNFETVGCRDEETQNRFNKKGINNYFSGCLTLTINKFEEIKKENYICIVDVQNDVTEKIKQNTKREVKLLSHNCIPEEIKNKGIEERIKDVEDLLKIYQGAHVVITERLHVALPCVALGTPVIFICKQNFEKDRLQSYLKYVDYYDDKDFLNLDINKLIENPKENNNEYIKIRENLIKICEDFVKNSTNNEFDIEKLQDINNYNENYAKHIKWYKELYEEIRVKAKTNMINHLKTNQELYKKIDILNISLEERKQENDKLKNTIENNNLKINELEQIIKNNNLKINELENIIENNKLKINELTETLNFSQNEVNNLRKNNEEINNNLNLIYNSKGWKYLEKYRCIKRKMRFSKKGEK